MTAWKDLERRIARMWGGQRAGPTGRHGPDVIGVPLAIQVKRTARIGIRGSWITQAMSDGWNLKLPWVLVVAHHDDRKPVAVVDHAWLVTLWTEHRMYEHALEIRAENERKEGDANAGTPL